ncbi:MAG: CPBP family glutamic-type intramembrane protease [Candidatus Obscuribacterales bacterium]
MNWQNKSIDFAQIKLVFVKEMLEGIRDYRSLLPMIVFSVFIGPLFTIGVPIIAAGQVQHELNERFVVAFASSPGPVAGYLKGHKEFRVVPLGELSKEQALSEKKVDAVILVPDDFSDLVSVDIKKQIPTLTIYYDGKYARAASCAARLRSVLEYYKEYVVKQRLKLANIALSAPETVYPFVVTPTNRMFAASPFVQSMLVLILVFQAFMGVIYPSLDAITGERERGTLEALLSTPVRRSHLFIGKLAAITISSFAVVLSTLVGFYLSQFIQIKYFSFLPATLASQLNSPLAVGLPLPCVILVALMMLPLCLSMAAAAMALATFARTVQQAQAYMLPLMLITTIPLSVMALGEVHIDGPCAFVPFLNSIVAMDDSLSGRIAPLYMLTAAFISTAFALTLCTVVAPVVDREDILFGIEESPTRRFSEQNFGRELFFLCSTVFLLMFYLSQILVLKHHLLGMALTQLLVILLPGLLLALFWLKLPTRAVLRLYLPKGGVLTLIGALMLAPLSVLLAGLLATLFTKLVPGSAALSKLMEEYMGLNTQPLWLLLLVLGVMPAVCEELLFRGVILSLMPKRFSTMRRVLTVGGMFGAFHMSLLRFLPTGLLGCVLTFLAIRTGSVFPCMLLHAGHNMLSVFIAVQLKEKIGGSELAIGIVTGLAGLAIIIFAIRSAEKKENEKENTSEKTKGST